jgi:hypothetical protein
MTNHISDHLSNSTKYVVDAVSMFTVLGTLVDFLPAAAAAFTIIWTRYPHLGNCYRAKIPEEMEKIRKYYG